MENVAHWSLARECVEEIATREADENGARVAKECHSDRQAPKTLPHQEEWTTHLRAALRVPLFGLSIQNRVKQRLRGGKK
jgi:hypothetical protein